MVPMRTIVVVGLALVTLAVLAPPSEALSFDLKTDWSDVSNPNGAWSYRDGGGALPSQPTWIATQPAWARAPFAAPGHIVAWMKATAASATCAFPIGPNCDFVAGDVLTHTWDAASSGPSTPPSQVVWTAPSSGEIDISGNVWLARNIGRAVNWTLLVDGVVKDSGSLFDGDAFSRASPDAFSFFDVFVDLGDLVVLRFDTVSTFGDFVGANLAIDLTPRVTGVPEPATMLLLGSGLAGAAVLISRRKRV